MAIPLRFNLKTSLLMVAIVAAVLGLVAMDLRADRSLGSSDIVALEVRTGVEDRPISGTFLIRPDGMISLGSYGRVNVGGLRLDEAKAKIAAHLRNYLDDESIGLIESHLRGRLQVSRAASSENADPFFMAITRKGSHNSNIMTYWIRFTREVRTIRRSWNL